MTQVTLNNGSVDSSGSLLLKTNGTTTAVTLDTAQNMGLGVTPSAWNSVYKGLQIGLGASIYGRTATSTAAITSNAFVNSGGNFQYINSDGASYYLQSGGVHYWTTAASGTAGTAITFTQAMTLDASGNLGLGVTPSAWNSDYKAIQIGALGEAIYARVSTNEIGLNQNYYRDTSAAFKYIGNGYAASYIMLSGGGHAWFNAPNNVSGAGAALTLTQAMTLDASGNLGIGTTSPGYKLAVAGTAGSAVLNLIETGVRSWGIRAGGAATNTFDIADFTAGATRLTIDSSGNLLVGTTSTGGVGGISIRPNLGGAGTYGRIEINQNQNADGMSFKYNGTEVGRINIGSSSTTYVTSSDYRLKENVAAMTGALDAVASLKPCTYTWKSTNEVGQGFIAHELAEVCPQAVVGEKDAVDEEGNAIYQGIDTSFLVATLTAAIQELKAELDAAKARITALEA